MIFFLICFICFCEFFWFFWVVWFLCVILIMIFFGLCCFIILINLLIIFIVCKIFFLIVGLLVKFVICLCKLLFCLDICVFWMFFLNVKLLLWISCIKLWLVKLFDFKKFNIVLLDCLFLILLINFWDKCF